jgi:hypothetical protein
MIIPMQFHSLESLDPKTVQIQLIPPKNVTWQAGQKASFAIPKKELGPASSQPMIAASNPDEFFFEFSLPLGNTPFSNALLLLEEKEQVYVKLEDDVYQLPESGTWIITADSIDVARAYAKKYQATANEIMIILYQTGKTYFSEITRVCGQNPQFIIRVANRLDELRFHLQEVKHPLSVAATQADLTWLMKWLIETGVESTFIQQVTIG